MATHTATTVIIIETGIWPVPGDRPPPAEVHAMSRMAWLSLPYLPIS